MAQSVAARRRKANMTPESEKRKPEKSQAEGASAKKISKKRRRRISGVAGEK